jgi:hypothetical protein
MEESWYNPDLIQDNFSNYMSKKIILLISFNRIYLSKLKSLWVSVKKTIYIYVFTKDISFNL